MTKLEQYAGYDGLNEDIFIYLVFEALVHMPRPFYSLQYNIEQSDDKTWQNAVLCDPKYMNLENLHNSPQV